jgi:GTP-binding protein HflX
LSRERVILVGVATGGHPKSEVERHLDELERLVDTAGGEVVGRDLRARSSIDARTYIGAGAVEELAAEALALRADLVVFDDDLSPGQARNLEETLPRVADRSGIILEIFSRHARSREARTQVELARYEYLLPRLTGKYKGLSRLGGGIGGRGAGEQQLELDRRKIRHRISLLKKDLAKIETSRRVQRRGRRGHFTVAIAGYTNAGKTTLYNRLTHAEELAADRLFATLDARVARLPGESILLVDTVGLIRKLPAGLVASFRSTLSEIRDADLVLHAVDASSDTREEERRIAEETFSSLSVDPARVLTVYTKTDAGKPPRGALGVSALTGEGIERLLSEIERRAEPDARKVTLRIPYSRPREIARARAGTRVLAEKEEDEALRMVVSATDRSLRGLEQFEIS